MQTVWGAAMSIAIAFAVVGCAGNQGDAELHRDMLIAKVERFKLETEKLRLQIENERQRAADHLAFVREAYAILLRALPWFVGVVCGLSGVLAFAVIRWVEIARVRAETRLRLAEAKLESAIARRLEAESHVGSTFAARAPAYPHSSAAAAVPQTARSAMSATSARTPTATHSER